jgi:hypothetical protein
VEGKSFRLADEVRYIQRRAADRDGRIVTIGQLVLFSTETGDAWLLDPADPARRKAGSSGGERADPHRGNRYHLRHWLEGRYRIEGAAFVYSDHDTGRVTTILGTRSMSSIRRLDREISNVFG